MIRLITLFFTIFPLTASAGPSVVSSSQINSMMGYLRQAPASVTGSITAGRTVMLADDGISKVRMNGNFPLSFDLTETGLTLNSRAGEPGAITLMIGPMPIKVNSVSYDTNGNFSVDVKTPGRILERELERKVAEELEKKFKRKMERAFIQLRTLREQRTIGDAQQVITSISGIFADGNAASSSVFDNLPLSGDIRLEIKPPADQTMEVGQLSMDITADDRISAGIDFSRTGTGFQIDRISLQSYEGIVVRPQGPKRVDIRSARVTQINIDSNGMSPTYVTGPEEAMGGISLLVTALLAYQGSQDLGTVPYCDPDMRIDALQNWLNCRLNGGLAEVARENIEVLRSSGIRTNIINGMLNPPSTPENCDLGKALPR